MPIGQNWSCPRFTCLLLGIKLALPQGSLLQTYSGKTFKNLPGVKCMAQSLDICYIALSRSSLPRVTPEVKSGPTPGVTCFTQIVIQRNLSKCFGQNCMAYSLNICCFVLSCVSLQRQFKVYPWGQNFPKPKGQLCYMY